MHIKSRFLTIVLLGLILVACQPTTQLTAVTPTDEPLTSTPSPFIPTDVVATATEEEKDQTETISGDGSPNADVLFVRAVLDSDGTWTFHVTVSHPDSGWEDYADGWDVVTNDGTVLKVDPEDPFTRLLLHPHVEEQPFTRSQSGIQIPPEVTTVTVRAHDLLAGFGGQEVTVDLDQPSGLNYEVIR